MTLTRMAGVQVQMPGTRTLSNDIGEALRNPLFDSMRLMVAFFTMSGWKLIGRDVETFCTRGGSMNCLIGTDFGLTEASAVRKLVELQDRYRNQVSVRLVQMRGAKSFHPKLYWFRGPNQHQLVVGSSNFTGGGLATNVEASVVHRLMVRRRTDSETLDEMEDAWMGMVRACNEGSWVRGLVPTADVLAALAEANRRARRIARIARQTQVIRIASRNRTRRQAGRITSLDASKVLVMDLLREQGGTRTSQVQPPMKVWMLYFGIDPRHEHKTLFLSDLRTGDAVKRANSIHHHNSTIELPGARDGRILKMTRISPSSFEYEIYKKGDAEYARLDRLLSSSPLPNRQKRRIWPPTYL